ncbi:2-C-methyl-D-erythritol 4-phosphate cytidylyltransferase [Ferruginibacter yonginensis]|uniref:2-C-methyl-D-erythritol 4-phosphate cytidylyltransferase n=1 Tax=Ferruginibacter yonginensis TaxID=1310416 RepID=A0ABV8QP61_9BACT
MKKYVILVAGGNGTRMNSVVPKQFLLLNGKPVLYYAMNTFLQQFPDCKIILVLPEEHIAAGQEIIDAFFDYSRIDIVTGGRTRFHSVQNGLAMVQDENSVIFVHDAVRPLVSGALLQRCLDAVLEFGSAIPVVDCKDSLRRLVDDGNEAVDRSLIKLVQTPQAFHGKILLPAFKIDYKDKFTDEANVVEAFGLKVMLVEGDAANIKITQPADLIFAAAMLQTAE